MAGDGPLLELATVTEFLPTLKPRVVLWFYYEGNDLTDLEQERESALLKKYLDPSFHQAALERQADIDRAILAEIPRLERIVDRNEEDAPANARRYRLMTFLKLTALRQRLGLVDGSDPSDPQRGEDLRTTNMEVFRDTLREAKARIARWGGQLYFVYLPEWARYNAYTSWGEARRTDVLNTVSSLGIKVIDLDPAFRARRDPLSLFPFRALGHYTEAGHRLVADEVLRAIDLTGSNDR
jgi:hypothetical protein